MLVCGTGWRADDFPAGAGVFQAFSYPLLGAYAFSVMHEGFAGKLCKPQAAPGLSTCHACRWQVLLGGTPRKAVRQH